MIRCLMLINRRGLIRLVKWFDMAHIPDKDKLLKKINYSIKIIQLFI